MRDNSPRELKVRMLGQLDCTFEGRPVSLITTPGAKLTQLFLILLYMAPDSCTKQYALSCLYADSEADSANSFKTLLFRLRETLAQELDLPKSDCVILSGGRLFLSSRIRVDSDVHRFLRLARAGLDAMPGEKKQKLLTDAVREYHGSFLPALSTETEVIFANAQIQDTFSRVIRALAASYQEEKNYTAMYQTLQQGMRFDPFNEEWICGAIDALALKGSFRQAMVEYDEKAQMILDEFGAYPSERLLDSLRRVNEAMRAAVENRPAVTDVLDDDNVTGAYYCSYPAFQGSYHILRRIMSREHLTSALLLVTVVDRKGQPLEEKGSLTEAVTSLRMAVGRSLRKNDMYTRYSRNQLLILLWGTPEENVETVVNRIRATLRTDYEAERFDIRTDILKDPRTELASPRPKIWHTEPRGV